MKTRSKSRTRKASRTRAYDLHNHVIPEQVVQAIRRHPDRFGTRIEEKDGKRYFDSHGRMTELLPEFCDVEAKLAWMDRVGMDVSRDFGRAADLLLLARARSRDRDHPARERRHRADGGAAPGPAARHGAPADAGSRRRDRRARAGGEGVPFQGRRAGHLDRGAAARGHEIPQGAEGDRAARAVRLHASLPVPGQRRDGQLLPAQLRRLPARHHDDGGAPHVQRRARRAEDGCASCSRTAAVSCRTRSGASCTGTTCGPSRR